MSGTWATGWLAGDIVTAAEMTKGVGAIYDTTLTGSAASIDITGIVDDYAQLLLILFSRGDTAAVGISQNLRLNNDSGSNYSWQRLTVSAATTTAAEGLSTTSINIGGAPGASAAADRYATTIVFIPAYTAVERHSVTGIGFSAEGAGSTSGTFQLYQFGGQWDGTAAALNRLTILPSAGNFAIGTRATLYGMGA